MVSVAVDPLFGDIPERILLSKAPLIRVLGQVRFTRLAKISDESYIAEFQEAIRGDYPYFQGETIQGVDIVLTGNEVKPRSVTSKVWRFFNGSKSIRVTLGADQITIETMKYVSRDDFLGRLEFLISKLKETINPSLVERVGFRYVNRIQGNDLKHLGELVTPPMLNIAQPALIKHVEVSMSEISATTKEGKLIARYGIAPPNYTHDPEMAPQVPRKSWVLDVDSFSLSCSGREFDVTMLRQELDRVAARAYAFFRWGVTPQFLEHFGGEN